MFGPVGFYPNAVYLGRYGSYMHTMKEYMYGVCMLIPYMKISSIRDCML